ncbi:MAG TPA: phosphonate C-P lyase system protein PhnH, partial [Spirochaetia bacterium]|nr:phosphonate C-P lyase system protein PhnH [Spirochaetia bacterium]
CASMLSILKTLCDHRVSFSVGSSENTSGWVGYLDVNLSTPFRAIAEAAYVIFEGDRFDEDFQHLNRGTLEFPETSATALLCVRNLRENPGAEERVLHLSGPGVQDGTRLCVDGLHPRYLEERARANRFFPLGIDLFLVDHAGNVAGIPRTSIITAD